MHAKLLNLCLLLGLLACETAVFNADQLIGTWQGASWILEDGKTRPADALQFTFSGEGTYQASYGNASEQGTYRLRGDKLYTTETNKIEKMVKVTQLTNDTLAFEMNRMGTYEKMVLVKK